MIYPADALDVQIALSRLTRLRVTTRQLNGHEVQYLIGYTYTLTLDEHQLNQLARDIDSPSQFKEVYDDLKYDCLEKPAFMRST